MLSLVDTFATPYITWETRPATPEEMYQNQSLDPIKLHELFRIDSALSAAIYAASNEVDNRLTRHVQDALNNSVDYRSWQNTMPSCTPPEIARYQNDYENSDYNAVSQEIEQYGSLLSPGQSLFHGGHWKGGRSHVIERPLSTSLCPQVALLNALHKGKAYDAGRLDLLMLRAAAPQSKVFAFKNKGANLSHESEVLVNRGAQLTLIATTPVQPDRLVVKFNAPNKRIPVYVLEVEVS